MPISNDQWSKIVLHIAADSSLREKVAPEEWNQTLTLLEQAPTLAVLLNNFLYFHSQRENGQETNSDDPRWEEFLHFAHHIAHTIQEAIEP